MSNHRADSNTSRPPRPELVLEAVKWLQEGLTIPDFYFRAILDLVEQENVRRARARRRSA
jgi:hypothetical protein